MEGKENRVYKDDKKNKGKHEPKNSQSLSSPLSLGRGTERQMPQNHTKSSTLQLLGKTTENEIPLLRGDIHTMGGVCCIWCTMGGCPS